MVMFMESPMLAAVLSFLIPGLGQAYLGDIEKGVKFFIVEVFLLILTFLFFPITIIDLLYSIYVAYDAYQMTI